LTKKGISPKSYKQKEVKNSQVKSKVETLVNNGLALEAIGQYRKALESYNKALAIDLDNVRALVAKRAVLTKLSKPSIEKLPVSSKAASFFNIAQSFDSQGKYTEALKYYDYVLEIEPNYALAWNNKGVTLYKMGKPKEALTCLERALGINPNYADAWYNRGATLYSLNKYDEALNSFNNAVKLNPDDAEAWTNRGLILLHKLGQYDEALKSFNRALEINPDDTLAWRNKGRALYKLDRYKKAIFSYDKAIEINPNDASVWVHKGLALCKLGRPKEAIECLWKAINVGLQNRYGTKGKEKILKVAPLVLAILGLVTLWSILRFIAKLFRHKEEYRRF
jgi:tetratricopeptide (TPR) repeat protein